MSRLLGRCYHSWFELRGSLKQSERSVRQIQICRTYTLKPSKCSLFQKQAHYLGHVVTKDGVEPDPKTTDKVRNWPRPRTVTEVRAFLGLAQYYRKFVKNFSIIAAPLHRLTQKDITFDWNEDCQQAFDVLRQSLTHPPIMAFPDFGHDFMLYTDASDTAVGSVLSQKIDGKERVIAYASHLFNKT